MTGFATTTHTGTTLKFHPPTGSDTMLTGRVERSIMTRLQCITCMKEYENKSLEELRVEDYAANRKGGTTGGIKQEIKFVSCAIQTDISAIDTKDPKNQNLPFLQTKDVTLLTESMKELFIKGSDYDVKITVQDKQFQAHRLILRTRSPVFAMMLTHDSKESITGTIKIEDCDPDSFDEFLLYLYSGRVENLTPTKALHLYYTADKYDIPALKERCVILLKSSLSVESICDVVLLAKRYDEKELLEEATKFFAQNLREILVTVHWQKFLCNNPIEGNELYIKSIGFFPRK